MKSFTTIYTERNWVIGFLCQPVKKLPVSVSLIALISFLLMQPSAGGGLYAQCATSAPSVLAKWDFNSQTLQCNGATMSSSGDNTAPFLAQGKYYYCPGTNSGCGKAILGSRGFSNTYDFKNALCLSGYWRQGSNAYAVALGWSPVDPVFKPEIGGNIFVSQTFPVGKAGTITSFSLKLLQKQYDGATLPYEKQGVGVYRNGVKIYETTQVITASNVNGTAMTFTFPNTADFSSDGSTEVKFEIVFGLVHRLTQKPVGYDDICINGICGGSPAPTADIGPATCGASSANSNGTITLSNFGATDHYDFNTGNTYTGGKDYAGSALIPVGGVITNTLPNPASPQVYTIRVFSSAGCTTDLHVTLNPTVCPGNTCTAPTATVTPTAATCTGTSANSNASIAITGVTGGTKVGISPGASYSGPAFSAAQALNGGAYTFTGLLNPNGSQIYTVRVFNADDNCFKDYPVTLLETDCGCKKIAVQVKRSDQGDPDSGPNNNAVGEDDLATYEVCVGTGHIDLKLTKTVTPLNGTTCPTNTPFVWTLTLTNEGTMTATNIQVADNMPAGLIETASNAATGTYNLIAGWSVPSLAAGASTTLTITTHATKAGTYQNCAWVNGAFPLNDIDSSPLNDGTANEDDDDCASITVTGAKTPEIVKEFSPQMAKTGVPIRLTIKITNNESVPINLTAALVDNLPSSPAQMTIAPTSNLTTGLAGVVATAGGTSITVPSGTVLLPGLNQIQVDVIASAEGMYCNKILAGALQTGSCNNIAETEACVEVRSTYVMAPLIKKSFSPEVVQTGHNSTLTITIENRNATGITVLQDFKDELPLGLVVAGAVSGTCPGISTFSSIDEVGILSGSVIVPGTCTITVPVTGSSAGTFCNRIVQNAMIGSVSNGSIQVMTGNEDISEACLKVDPNPCASIDLTGITPPSPTVVPNGTVSLTANGTGLGASTVYIWSGTGSFTPQAATTTYTAPATQGTYTLTLTADNGLTGYGTCKDIITLQVVVQNACVKPDAGADQTPTCISNTAITTRTLAATAVSGGSWSQAASNPLGASITAPSSANSGVTGLVPGVYQFIWSTSATCSDTVKITIPDCSCIKPSGITIIKTAPTCTNNTPNNDGKITLNSINDTDKYGVSTGSSYSGTPNYAAATVIGTSPLDLKTAISNIGGIYTIRFFNGTDGCYKDTTVTIAPVSCIIACVKPNAGTDQTPSCVGNTAITTRTLAATAVSGGSWSQASSNPTGASITTPSSANSGVTGLAPGVYEFIWSTSATCSDTVKITIPNCAPTPKGSLGDYVWKDTNNDGRQDAGEPGVKGVIIELYKNGLLFAKDTTDLNGKYGFVSLDSASYKIKVVTSSLPDSCAISLKPNAAGVPDSLDSDVSPTTYESHTVIIDPTPIIGASLKDNPTLDVALRKKAVLEIGDPCSCFGVEYAVDELKELYEELTVTSAPGETWTVVSQTGMLQLDTLVKIPLKVGALLTEKSPGKYVIPFTIEDNIPYSVKVTNGKDTLTFANICERRYPEITLTILNKTICRNSPPVPLTATSVPLANSYEFFYEDKITGQRVVITKFDPSKFSPADTIYIKMEAGATNRCPVIIVQPVVIQVADCPVGSLGDYVWKDGDNNGIQGNAGDIPVQGVILELYKNGVVTGIKDTTDSNGKYLFTIADSASYHVKILPASLPAGYVISPKQNIGADDKDSDFNPTTGLSDAVTVNPFNIAKRNVLTIDAALVTTCVKPTWILVSTPTCSINNQTYSVTFTVTGKNGVLKANGIPVTGNSPYTVTIPSGTNLILSDSLSSTCHYDSTIVAPFCGCPISAPTAIAPSVSICEGEALPTLQVNVSTGATANWYASQTGATPLATHTLTYKPTAPGTYWVEAVVTGAQGCISTIRTPITLSVILNKCVPVTVKKIRK